MPSTTADVPYPLDSWTSQVRKGILELAVLNALVADERYGYDLVKSLVAVPGLGITEGTLYPLLSRLRVSGLVDTRLVESKEGPARKYYRLSAAGRTTVGLMNRYFDDLLCGLRILRQWSQPVAGQATPSPGGGRGAGRSSGQS